jgi:DNA-binding NarL/FixJ family response regulator
MTDEAHGGVSRVGLAGGAWAGPRSTMVRGGTPLSKWAGRSIDCLTPRQREVLELMATGVNNASIADRLVISEKAVVQHTSQIYDRLDLAAADDTRHRRVAAVVRYLAHASA